MDNRMYPNNDQFKPGMMPQVELAQASVPFQIMGKVFSPREALCKGTLFPELYKPYVMGKKYKK